MDPDVIRLFSVMMAILIPLGLGGGIYILLASYVRRSQTRNQIPQGDGLEELRARVEELEHRESRLGEIEERLDFIERLLPKLREPRPRLESPRGPIEKTPV